MNIQPPMKSTAYRHKKSKLHIGCTYAAPESMKQAALELCTDITH